jgi:hypothetical protein
MDLASRLGTRGMLFKFYIHTWYVYLIMLYTYQVCIIYKHPKPNFYHKSHQQVAKRGFLGVFIVKIIIIYRSIR